MSLLHTYIHERDQALENRLIAFKPSGEILYTRCTVYWCSRTIAYFNEVYSFFKRQYITLPSILFFGNLWFLECSRLVNAGDKELFCPTCYIKMMNALYFSGHNPLGLLFGLLPSHNLQ